MKIRLYTLRYCVFAFAIVMPGILSACSRVVTRSLSVYRISVRLPIGWQVSEREMVDDALSVERRREDGIVGSIWMQSRPTDDSKEDILVVWKRQAEKYAQAYPESVVSDPVLTSIHGYVAAQGTIFWEGKISREPGPGEFVAEWWNNTFLELLWIDLNGEYLVVGGLVSVNKPAPVHVPTEQKATRIAAEVNSVIESLRIESLK